MRRGTLVGGDLVETLRADRGDCSPGLGSARRGAAVRRGLCLLVAAGLRAPPGRSNDRAGRAVERTRARQALQPRPPQDELTQLGATLDGLLDRLGASLRHERRFSAELSHELRTPLARIIAEAELALRRERKAPEYRDALGDVLRNARQVARIVDALFAAARHEASPSSGTADAFAVATKVAAHCEQLAVQSGVTIQVEPPSTPVRVGVDGDLAERILHPVVENACRYGARRFGSRWLAPTVESSSASRTTGQVSATTSTRRSSSRGHEARPAASRATAPDSGSRWRDAWPGRLRATSRREPEIRAGSFVVDLPAG